MAYEIIGEQTFGGRMGDAEHAMAVFRAHTDEVRATIAPERLLVYDVAEGWEPLCEFLAVAVPETSFPRIHSTEEFQRPVDKSGSNGGRSARLPPRRDPRGGWR